MPEDQYPWPRTHHFLVTSTERLRMLKRTLKAEKKWHAKLKARLDTVYNPDYYDDE